MPVVQPADVWERSGRYSTTGQELVRLSDRRNREMVLAMTHEEIVAGLAASEVDSYQRLPRLVYQIQTKFRDDARPRAGLIRAREFTMKDAYSLDSDERGLDQQYSTLYRGILQDLRPVRATSHSRRSRRGHHGREHGPRVHVPYVPSGRTPSSSATIAATPQTARLQGFASLSPKPRSRRPMEKISTPGTSHYRDTGPLPGDTEVQHGQGGLPGRHGRWLRAVRFRRRPWRHGAQRDQTGERGRGERAEARATRGGQGRRSRAWVRVSARGGGGDRGR